MSDQEKIGDTWERLRRQERDERDARIRAELEQVERISKAIVEDEST